MSKKNDKSKNSSGKKQSKKEAKKEKKVSKKTNPKPMKPQFVWPKDELAMKKDPVASETTCENTLHPEEAGFASFEEPKLDGTETPFVFTSHISVGTSANIDDIKNKATGLVEKAQNDIKKAWKFFVRKMKGLA